MSEHKTRKPSKEDVAKTGRMFGLTEKEAENMLTVPANRKPGRPEADTRLTGMQPSDSEAKLRYDEAQEEIRTLLKRVHRAGMYGHDIHLDETMEQLRALLKA